MSAGKFAADVCGRALDAGCTDASFLSQYQTLWNHDFGAEIKLFRRVLKRVLLGDRDEHYIRLISKDPEIINLLFTMANKEERIQAYQWKIARRLFSLYINDLLG
jgi:flavin-dependent dehydrogenase